MRLSHESPRVRWLALVSVWVIVATVALLHSQTVRGYLGVVGQLGLRGAEAPSTPMKQAFPAFAADAQTWVRHALSLVEGEQVRLRYTHIDNAPNGREVHWNSAWAWTIALGGYIEHWVTGAPLPQAIERVIVWLNAIALLILTILISSWVSRRAGALAGVILAVSIIGHPRVYEGFFPGYVDHHGLLTLAALAVPRRATACFLRPRKWRGAQPRSPRFAGPVACG
ncbi:MAG: hypothetical protein HZC55_05020 [Verrucomicrobia bacterium]|nr:hypothetical protein [Verrucomicrobiota bacterium]